MGRRARRWGGGVVGAMAAAALVLAGWELYRRHQQSSAGEQLRPSEQAAAPASQEFEQKFRDPGEFARFCAAVRERTVALRDRSTRLEYTHLTRVTELDRKGNEASVVEYTDRVWSEGGQKHREERSRRQVKGSLTREQFERYGQSGETQQEQRKAVQPFSREEGEATYDYRFEGVEEVGGRPAVKIRVEPREVRAGLLRGVAWADAGTAEPVRFHATVAKPPALVDRYEIFHEYGPSENGHTQTRRATVDVSGGLAFFSYHYKIENTFSDYRERPGQEKKD